MAYMVFHDASVDRASHVAHYKDDLAALYSVLGSPAAFPFYLVEIGLTPTAAFGKIAGLKKGDKATGFAVREALLNTRLFQFANPVVTAIQSQ